MIISKFSTLATAKSMSERRKSKEGRNNGGGLDVSSAFCKCALGLDRITYVLVAFHSKLIKNRFYPKQWLKILDAMLGKGNNMVIRKLRIIT